MRQPWQSRGSSISRLLRHSDVVVRFFATYSIVQVAVGPSEGSAAISAFDRFGKGRHPAKLNMGDCFAYACAKNAGAKLLYKGNDFGFTDIEAA